MLALLSALTSRAFNVETTREQYIEMWKEEAIYQMVTHQIPASITLAQGILESRDGNSRLAKEGNNHFGIKCHNDWDGKRIYEDDETSNECFRQYKNARESFDDHSVFLKKPRYAPLFELDPDDYKGWAKGLRECGYATNPDYAKLLIRIIEENNLTEFDRAGLAYAKNNEVPPRKNGDIAANIPAVKPAKTSRRQRVSDEQETRSEIVISNRHEVLVSDNQIKYVVLKEGETINDIAQEIDLNIWILYKFNDLNESSLLKAGDIVYLQPKRNKGSKDTYTVEEGDSWFGISQKCGIKQKQLLKINSGNPASNPTPGTTLRLKKA